MLTLSTDILPQTDLTYLAFRAAFQETLERIVLAQQVSLCEEWIYGYLTEVPILRHVAPQVQLDLLLDTWQRHQHPDVQEATLLDESIVYSVCETSARLVRNDPSTLQRFLADGPRALDLELRPRLAHGLVALHLSLCPDADFLLITQFLDLPPREARTLMAEFGLHPADCDPLLEALGRWHIDSNFARKADGLLTADEIRQTLAILSPLRCNASPL